MTRVRFPPLLAALLVLALAGAAAWFRIAHILRAPLWLDEAYSAYAAGKGFDFLWHVTPRYETHPPFYYSLLRLWTLVFGDGLASLRAPGIVCGMLTVPVMALAAREAARWLELPRAPVMLAAFALAALSPTFVEMAREARPYPVLILVYAVAIAALLRTGRIAARDDRIAPAPFALYAVSLALVLWLHNLGVLYAAALGIAALLMVARRDLRARDWALFVGGHLLAGLAWLPALLILLDQAPTWIASTWLVFSTAHLQWRLFALWAAPGWIARLAAYGLVLLGVTAAARARDGWRIALALLVLAGLPAALSILISLWKAPVFIPRTMSAIAVPSLLLFAIGGGGWRGWGRLPGLALLLVLGWRMAAADIDARARGPGQDFYGAVEWLRARYRPGDEVWSYPNEGALPLDFAARDRGATFLDRPIPRPVPALDQGPGSWNPTGSRGVVSLSPARLHALATSPRARAIPTIWLHRLGANAYDKGDVLLDALMEDRVIVGEWEKGPIDIIGLRLAPTRRDAPARQGPGRAPAGDQRQKKPGITSAT